MLKINKKLIILFVILSVLFIFSTVIAVDYDFEGDKVSIGSFSSLDYYEEEVEYIERVKEVEEMFNVNIEFADVHGSDFQGQFITSVMAGDPIADIAVMPRDRMIYGWIPENVLYPLDAILDEEYFESLPPYHRGEKVKEYLQSVDGSYYMFSANGGIHLSQKILGAPYVMVWNKDLFEREGLPDLYEVYENGDWTYDKFLEICEKATEDTTSDGEIDQWGLVDYFPWQARIPILAWFRTNGIEAGEVVDGEIKYALNQEPAIETLNMLRDVYDYRTFDNFSVSKFVDGNVALMALPIDVITQITDMEDDYGLMFLPKGPNVEEITIATMHTAIALPITSERAEAKVELANALFRLTDDYQDMDEYIDEIIKDRAMDLRDRKSMEILEDMFEKWKVISEFNFHIPLQQLAPRVVQMAEGELSPIAAINELEPIVQSIFDDIYN